MEGDGKTVLLITGNAGKYREAARIAEGYGIGVKMLDYPKIEIQSNSNEHVSMVAALLAYSHLGAPLVVEDSGIFINALNGFPGVLAHFIKGGIGIEGVLKLMEGKKDRSAFFKAAVSYVDNDAVKCFTGICRGSISHKEIGEPEESLPFDSVFMPEGSKVTFAEMGVDEKSRYSHRAEAFKKLFAYLKEDRS